jgi:ribonuclease PH
MTRVDGRQVDDLREIKIERAWSDHPEGSVLIHFGATRVLCTASFTPGVPRWKVGKGEGWVTAEYAMLPRATHDRSDRESMKGKVGGRTHEISRLIGRSLRAVVDVAYVALVDAIEWAKSKKHIPANAKVLKDSVAAISVGIIGGEPYLDLAYTEDVRAETDMNVVVTGSGKFVEVQGTAEGEAFDRDELNKLLDLALKGTGELTAMQSAALGK